jgi:lipoxygenase homology domain-containing protein 1
VTLFGSEGRRTEKLHLQKSATNKDPFERNQTDKFRVRGDFVGELAKLRIEHDNAGRMPGWFLDRVGRSSFCASLSISFFLGCYH